MKSTSTVRSGPPFSPVFGLAAPPLTSLVGFKSRSSNLRSFFSVSLASSFGVLTFASWSFTRSFLGLGFVLSPHRRRDGTGSVPREDRRVEHNRRFRREIFARRLRKTLRLPLVFNWGRRFFPCLMPGRGRRCVLKNLYLLGGPNPPV